MTLKQLYMKTNDAKSIQVFSATTRELLDTIHPWDCMIHFYDEREIDHIDVEGDTLKVYIKETACGERYWYLVSTIAEEISEGYVYLSKKEAQIVKYATQKENWKNASLEGYSGCFFIDIDNPKEQLPEMMEEMINKEGKR